MSLFNAKKAQSKEVVVQECAKMIEAFLKKNNFNPSKQRLPNKNNLGWWVQRGSAIIYILLNPQGHTPTLRIISPILYLPENHILPFYRKCLELNTELMNCAFGVLNDKVVLVNERPIEGLDLQEFEDNMGYLAIVADDVDDKLSAEFNAQMYLDGGGELF
jgi:hypothetical protein